jgi:hypothetical protein
MQFEIIRTPHVYTHAQHKIQTFCPASWGHAYGLVRL